MKTKLVLYAFAAIGILMGTSASGQSYAIRNARMAATAAAVLDARERPALADQLGDPGAVHRRTSPGLRRDADLLGVHRHARRVEHVEVQGGGDPDAGVRGDGRDGGNGRGDGTHGRDGDTPA